LFVLRLYIFILMHCHNWKIQLWKGQQASSSEEEISLTIFGVHICIVL